MRKAVNSTPSLTTLTRSTSADSTASANRRCSTGTPKKSLSFSSDLCKIQLVECIANTPDAKNAIWYDGRELGGMRKKEIKKVKHAQIVAGQGKSIENDDITWRGFEDIQGHWCRVEKSAEYTTAVVKHYHSQVNQGYFDADELKRIAKGLSKQERERARNLALKDMADAGIKLDKKSRLRKSSSNIATYGIGEKSSKKTLRKTMSGAGLAQLRKSVSGANMMKLASRMSIGKGLSSTKRDSNASIASMRSAGKAAEQENFQWGVKKNGADMATPKRMAVLSS